MDELMKWWRTLHGSVASQNLTRGSFKKQRQYFFACMGCNIKLESMSIDCGNGGTWRKRKNRASVTVIDIRAFRYAWIVDVSRKA
jgi:hypothetical protein